MKFKSASGWVRTERTPRSSDPTTSIVWSKDGNELIEFFGDVYFEVAGVRTDNILATDLHHQLEVQYDLFCQSQVLGG